MLLSSAYFAHHSVYKLVLCPELTRGPIRLNLPESGGTVMLCPLQSRRPANEPLFPAFCACALSTYCCAVCSTTQAGTSDPDPSATKSVSTSVRGVRFTEQKGAG